MATLTNDLARLANNANVLVTAITTNSSAITSINVAGVVINSSGIISNSGFTANGSLGVAGQVLTTNGSGAYWSSAGVNTAATYTWSNAHTFNGVVTLGSGVGISANGSFGNSGDVLFSNGSAVYWAKDSTVQGDFPTGDYGSIVGSQDAFGVNILTVNSFDCNFSGPITNTDLGTTGSI
jgi:hypothetical protein